MRAMVFNGSESRLSDMQVPEPVPAGGELLIDIHACGVYRPICIWSITNCRIRNSR
jgi:propanol-preferring alcohol dehydrogenase